MQNQASNTKSKIGPGPGRPVGYRTPTTIKKLALKTLEQVMMDASAGAEVRVMAACKLIEEIKA